jgi:hypothetical protein
MEENKLKVELGDNDCAIVFRVKDESFSPELYVPKREDTDSVDTATALCVAISIMIRSKEGFVDECLEWMDSKIKEVESSIMNSQTE